VTILFAAIALTPSSTLQARELVDQAMSILGGRKKLESIRQLSTMVSGHNYLVEQSERPSGPYVTTYSRGSRNFDFDRLSETTQLTVAGLVYGEREVKRTYGTERGVGKGALPLESFFSLRRLALGPERALIHAADAADLALGSDTVFNGVPHHVVTFKWGQIPVRLFLKKGTGAPSGVETTSQLSFPWTTWGDVPMTTRWGNWQVLKGGVMEPTQFTTEIGSYPVSDETILSSSVTLGSGTVSVGLPQPSAKEDAVAMLARYRPVKVAEGITEYVGPFNTFVVEQPDGLVVIEPVLTSAFAGAFLDRLAKDKPGKRVKAVIATDDAWPHFGGLRTFVARGIEVIVLDLNLPLAQQFSKAVHRSIPDELALKPARPRFRTVRKPLTIGTGPTRLTLYPIAGQGSERMLMAYFPELRLLYGSDLLQKQGEGFFFPAYPKELIEAVSREHLEVRSVFAEHLEPTSWKVVTDFLSRVMS
jgi:glyoxylase-like metal-dependent hydrolase (beta-lactamase superfamily II)